MKMIDGHDVIEHAEVNGESREFIRKLMDYIEDADAVETKTGDLISREDAERYFGEFLLLNRFADFKKANIEKLVGKLCERIPSAEPKQGEWICHKGIWVDEEYYPTNYECNNCHHFVISGSDRNFCPNCGCRMKGADDE